MKIPCVVIGAGVYFFHNLITEELTGSYPLRKHGHYKK